MTTLAVDLDAYLPIGILVLMAIGFAVVNTIGTQILGPSAHGAIKESTYESGMNPFGTARKRFDVRFYILAMTFLVFDVEIIFLYPWAVTYTKAGAPDLVISGKETAIFEGDRIARLRDDFDPDAQKAMGEWMAAHGASLQ